MPVQQRAEGLAVYAALTENLAASGELIVSEALADPSMAKWVSVGDGEVITSDGPFAEVKEHLADFYLIECDSIDRAVQYAARIPRPLTWRSRCVPCSITSAWTCDGGHSGPGAGAHPAGPRRARTAVRRGPPVCGHRPENASGARGPRAAP